MLQTTGARSAFKLDTGLMIAPALGSMAACFSYFMRLVIRKFHVNFFAYYYLSQVCAKGQQNHSDEEED